MMLVAVALSGCGGRRAAPLAHHLPPEIATAPSDAALLRVSRTGGTAQLLHANTLAPRETMISSGLPDVSRILGASVEDRTVYAADNKDRLLAIDLVARRSRVITTSVKQFITAPDGTILGIDSSHHPVRFSNRSFTTFKASVDRGATLMRGPADQITAVGSRPGTLEVLGGAGEVRRLNVPSGRTVATWVGDLVAVTTDSGVVFADATGRQKPPVRFVKIRGNPVLATFSPSGHRLYVALRKGTLVMIDRFTRERLRDLELPGPVDRMRVDRSGRWLLAHGSDDSLWVIDLAKWVVTASRVAAWADDLPQVVDGKTLLIRNRADVMAFDLDTPTLTQRGVLLGGASDLYIMLPWLPKATVASEAASPPVRVATPLADSSAVAPPPPAALPPATDAAAPPPAPTATGTIYLQVSSSQNQDWAQALAKQLKDGGFPATVLDPKNSDEGYRVVIGPYATRADADAVGRRLGRSYFIVSPGSRDT